MPNQFSEKYKTLSNEALLDILDNKHHYELPAIQEAEEELEARNLSDAERLEAREKLEALAREKAKAQHERQEKLDQLKTTATKYMGSSAGKPGNRALNIILTLLSLWTVYRLFMGFTFFINLFTGTYPFGEWIMFYVLMQLSFPVIIILLWKRMEIGRILIIVWCSLSILVALVSVYQIWRASKTYGSFENYFPIYNLLLMFFFQIIEGALIYFFSTKNIRNLYRKTAINESEALDEGLDL